MSGRQRVRADELLVRQGLAASRSQAKVLILAGEVRSGDRLIQKPAELLEADIALEVREAQKYVGRGGYKLETALDAFELDVTGLVAADFGASTGGFTDCLLQRGAAKVYALDVGYGQLDYHLRRAERVVVMERVNVRYLESLPEPVDLVTIDTSFISLKLVLPSAVRVLAPAGQAVALVKPQFEAGRGAVNRRGVVTDEAVREQVVREIIEYSTGIGLGFAGVVRSPIAGPAGNEEFLLRLVRPRRTVDAEVERAIRDVFDS